MTETIGSMESLTSEQQELAAELVAKAREEGVELTGPNGLLTGLTKQVLESALETELADHLGYDKNDPAGDNSGNSRNGSRTKTVTTDIGPVEIEVPRDRNGSFDPQIVRKRQRRLQGINEMVLSLTARVILSFGVSRGCDLRRSVVDSVVDGTLVV